MSSSHFNEQYRFGSAGWADEHDIAAAGLFNKRGLQIGFFQGRALFYDGDAPLLTVAGAGAGKTRDGLGYVACASRGESIVFFDPKGELDAISDVPGVGLRIRWDAFGLRGAGGPSCNPLDILDPGQPTFHADCKLVARALIPVTSRAESKYFEQRAGDWAEVFLKFDAWRNGWTSLPRLVRIINLVESGKPEWPALLEAMLASPFEDVRRAAGEILAKQQDSPREFGSIMGEVYANLSFLNDPVLSRALERSDFSLSALCDPVQPVKIFLIVPAEYLTIFAPVLRLFFRTVMLYKSRAPGSPRVSMVVDEAGQLGAFEALLQAFTFGRGMGIRTWAFFQDTGQPIKNFGVPGLQSLMNSAYVRQFFGIRDYQTAKLISDMLGSETLEYDDTRMQGEARRQAARGVMRAMEGEDLFGAALDIAHHSKIARLRTKQTRLLMTPDEIMGMSETQQIIFISGMKPIMAERYPYYTRREMQGLYAPNPYHAGSASGGTRKGWWRW
jgi:type IV secretion system protein VirD4